MTNSSQESNPLGNASLMLGVAGFFGSKSTKATAILGLNLGLTGICLSCASLILVGIGG